MKSVKFRELKASEIEAKACSINRGGVRILLWKGKFATQDILNETVGAECWRASYTQMDDAIFCELSVKTDSGIVTGSGISDEKGVKFRLRDALDHAAAELGIGRSLYNTPELFIPKSKLSSYAEENGSFTCKDRFAVREITYSGDAVESIVIDIYGRFGNKVVNTVKIGAAAEKTGEKPGKGPERLENGENPAAPAKDENPDAAPFLQKQRIFAPDEVMLIGDYNGMTFEEASKNPKFPSLLNWAASKSGNRYSDPVKKDQFERLKELAAAAA